MKQKILILGDSHVKVWHRIKQKGLIDAEIVIAEVGGATSQGVINPNSKSNSLIEFDKALEENKWADRVIVKLGEVDCGFAIWYYSEKFGVPVYEQLDRSLSSLEKFITTSVLSKFTPKDIILAGAPLPTVKDQTDRRFLTGARAEINASLNDRVRLTLLYNSRLKEMAKTNSWFYMDITEKIFEPRTGEVKDAFLSKDPFDHHLDDEATSFLWAEELNKIL